MTTAEFIYFINVGFWLSLYTSVRFMTPPDFIDFVNLCYKPIIAFYGIAIPLRIVRSIYRGM